MFIYIALAFVFGLLARPYLDRHKHEYEVILHSDLSEDDTLRNLTFTYTRTPTEAMTNFKVDGEMVNVTYKKCTKCKHCLIDINAHGRTTKFDFDVVKKQLDQYILDEKEKKDQALFDTLNKRLAEKEGLTSTQVPYNPVHANQATPQ